MKIIGPSGPTARPDATARQTPNHFTRACLEGVDDVDVFVTFICLNMDQINRFVQDEGKGNVFWKVDEYYSVYEYNC